ncbi:MAG: FeoA family protein [Mobilitalea sp.]
MTLQEAKIGVTYVIASMDLDQATSRRLGVLGLTKGTKIKVLNRNLGGAVILMVRGSRLALGKRITQTIHMGETA